MTDKQIIIDGIDVSGCESIIEDYQRANNFESRYEHIKNVCELGERGAEYYNLFCKDNPNCHYKNWQRKEQECEWWKRQAELGSDTTDRLAKQLEEKEQELDECREKLHKQLDQLKQALEETREIAEDAKTKVFVDMEDFWEQILQKCEVLKDE